jgi:hypothetical protein
MTSSEFTATNMLMDFLLSQLGLKLLEGNNNSS